MDNYTLFYWHKKPQQSADQPSCLNQLVLALYDYPTAKRIFFPASEPLLSQLWIVLFELRDFQNYIATTKSQFQIHWIMEIKGVRPVDFATTGAPMCSV